MSYHCGNISHIRVSKTKDGWICSGPIKDSAIAISGDKAVVIERYKRRFYFEGFKVKPCTRSFQRDAYYITALSLVNGRVVYRTKINIDGHPLQGCSVSPWRDNVVVMGYIQKKPGVSNRISFTVILDSRGGITNQFSIPPTIWLRIVDEKNSLLLCQQAIDANDSDKYLDPQILHMLELPSGTEKFQVEIAPFNYLVADEEGNIYINFLNQMSDAWTEYMEERTASVNTRIEKYSVLPWQKIWSTAIKPERGHCELLKYEDGILWYSICDENADFGEDEDRVIYPEDRRKWIDNPINCENGEKIESQQKCEPYRITTHLDGKQYVITKVKDKLHVKISSE